MWRTIKLMIGTISLAAIVVWWDSPNPKIVEPTSANSSSRMMRSYLLEKVDRQYEQWQTRFNQLSTSQQLLEYQANQRALFRKLLGPLPPLTPLNPQITGKLKRDLVLVEKVVLEVQPQHFLTGLLFLPDQEKYKAPYPNCLFLCGHSFQGKAHPTYQQACFLLARNGIATFIYDPIGQGERYQAIRKNGSKILGVPTIEHSNLGVGCTLLGRNLATYQMHDALQVLDYLESRPDLDSTRTGCLGNSGGGTQTAYLMTLDDRIEVAAVSCYLTTFQKMLHAVGPQDAEQNLFGQLSQGFEQADFLISFAPKPTLVGSAIDDYFPINGTRESFQQARSQFALLGKPDNITLTEHPHSHGLKPPLMHAVCKWMTEQLTTHSYNKTNIEELKVLTEKEALCTTQGQTLLLPDAKSVYELNQELNVELSAVRTKKWQAAEKRSLLKQVERLAGISPYTELKVPEFQLLGSSTQFNTHVTRYNLIPEPGIVLPVLLFEPKTYYKQTKRLTLYLHPAGISEALRRGNEVQQLLKNGNLIAVLEVRGTGSTFDPDFTWKGRKMGPEASGAMVAYLLGKSYLGMRTNDILSFLKSIEHQQLNSHIPADTQIDLIAHDLLALPALHAASLHTDRFSKVTLTHRLNSWSELLHDFAPSSHSVHVVHGALTHYDLPNLKAVLGNKLTEHLAP